MRACVDVMEMQIVSHYRWVPLNPNMDNPNFPIIQVLCQPYLNLGNAILHASFEIHLYNLKEFCLMLFVRIKRDLCICAPNTTGFTFWAAQGIALDVFSSLHIFLSNLFKTA